MEKNHLKIIRCKYCGNVYNFLHGLWRPPSDYLFTDINDGDIIQIVGQCDRCQNKSIDFETTFF